MSKNVNLYIDFGDKYIKAVAVDLDEEKVLGSVTVKNLKDEDLFDNFCKALDELQKAVGEIEYKEKIASSSKATGLRTIIIGNVEYLSTDAAVKAALSSSAEIVETFSKKLTADDISKINSLDFDIVLLCGGTDGGNRDCVSHNADMLLKLGKDYSVIYAGNKDASLECRTILEKKYKDVRIAENVMPEYNILNTASVSSTIKEIFMDKVFEDPDFKKVQKNLISVLIPSSMAVLNAVRLLAEGNDKEAGIGDTMMLDINSDRIEVYSVCKNTQYDSKWPIVGVAEPFAKRTIEKEFDLNFEVPSFIDRDNDNKTELDAAMSTITYKNQVQIAVERHAGRLETSFTPNGEVFVQSGKNLTKVKNIVGTGNIVLSEQDILSTLEGALFNSEESNTLAPSSAKFLIDDKNCMYAFGILNLSYPDKALRIMKQYLLK